MTRRTTGGLPGLIPLTLLGVTAATACTGGSSGGAAPSAAPAAQVSATTIAATPTPPSDADAALALALTLVNGVLTNDCPHAQQACVRPDDQLAGSIERGIASFEIGDPGGGAHRLVLAKDPDGAWKYWVSTQQDYQPYALPGPVRVCGEGQSTDIRESPDHNANVVAVLTNETVATGEQFVLTEPGVFETSTKGHGWYRMSAPVEGWLYSGDAYNPALPYACGDLRQGSEGSG